jgi:hypothetical protein
VKDEMIEKLTKERDILINNTDTNYSHALTEGSEPPEKKRTSLLSEIKNFINN